MMMPMSFSPDGGRQPQDTRTCCPASGTDGSSLRCALPGPSGPRWWDLQVCCIHYHPEKTPCAVGCSVFCEKENECVWQLPFPFAAVEQEGEVREGGLQVVTAVGRSGPASCAPHASRSAAAPAPAPLDVLSQSRGCSSSSRRVVPVPRLLRLQLLSMCCLSPVATPAPLPVRLSPGAARAPAPLDVLFQSCGCSGSSSSPCDVSVLRLLQLLSPHVSFRGCSGSSSSPRTSQSRSFNLQKDK